MDDDTLLASVNSTLDVDVRLPGGMLLAIYFVNDKNQKKRNKKGVTIRVIYIVQILELIPLDLQGADTVTHGHFLLV